MSEEEKRSIVKVRPQDTMDADPPFDAGDAILRLLVGLTLEGTDEITRRLREWEASILDDAESAAGAPTATDADRLRYAMIGLLFVARQRVERDVRRWFEFPGNAVESVRQSAERLARNPLLRPFAAPVMRRAESLASSINRDVDRWIQIGQAQEVQARAVSRVATKAIVQEVLAALADNDELQELIQQQGVGLAEEVVDSVREVTVTADAVLERFVRKVLGRKPRSQLSRNEIHLIAQPSSLDRSNNGANPHDSA